MEKEKSKLQISRIPTLNVLVIKQEGGRDFFTTTNNGIIISVNQLSNLILFLIKLGFLNPKVLLGILEDVNTSKFDTTKYKEIG
jgi:hypothetical protein